MVDEGKNIEHDPHLFVGVGGERKTKFVVTARGKKGFKVPEKFKKEGDKVDNAVKEEYLNRAKSTPLPEE